MSIIQCPNCGLFNTAGLADCIKCQTPFIIIQTAKSAEKVSIETFTKPSNRKSISARPSITNFVKNDFVTSVGLLSVLTLWFLYIGANLLSFLFFPAENPPAPGDSGHPFLYITIFLTIVIMGLLLWRAYSFQQVFSRGELVSGQITTTFIFKNSDSQELPIRYATYIPGFKDLGRIEYSYRLDRQTYQGGSTLMKIRNPRALKPGREIDLIINRENPYQAFIKDLYL